MSVWKREEKIFEGLPSERQANIEIVSSAYASMFAEKAYLTMPVTTGKRYYDTLDRYGVKTIDELERKRPGALHGEIIEPNIEEGKALASLIQKDNNLAIVVPGVFEARRQKWSQEEYMVLWLRLITSSVLAVYLSDGWEYSNGGAMEYIRALAIADSPFLGRFERPPGFAIYDHRKNRITEVEAAQKLAGAAIDLDRRGYNTSILRDELALLGGISCEMGDRSYPITLKILDLCDSVGVAPSFDFNKV